MAAKKIMIRFVKDTMVQVSCNEIPLTTILVRKGEQHEVSIREEEQTKKVDMGLVEGIILSRVAYENFEIMG